MSTLEPRVSRLEASEAASPKAPIRLVAALEDKMENMAGQQVGLDQITNTSQVAE